MIHNIYHSIYSLPFDMSMPIIPILKFDLIRERDNFNENMKQLNEAYVHTDILKYVSTLSSR